MTPTGFAHPPDFPGESEETPQGGAESGAVRAATAGAALARVLDVIAERYGIDLAELRGVAAEALADEPQ
jgi:hypothetical protein